MSVAAGTTYLDQLFSRGTSSPQFWLILAVIIGGAAVGIGIIWEAARSGHLWTLPTAFVFLGVVIEAVATIILFEFDEGISRTQQSKIERQNAEIIALDTKLAPRELTDKQLEALTGAVKQFAPQQYTLSIAVGSEPAALVCKIDAALKKAGWVRHLSTDFIKTKPFCNNEEWEVGINLISDIHVRLSSEANIFIEKAAVALAVSLKGDNIEARAEKTDSIKDATIVVIMIGAKL